MSDLLRRLPTYLLAILILSVPAIGSTQDSQSLSVSPTLFEMTASPTQVWQSSIKVANTNSYPLTLYARVVNFAPQGEGGTGKFVPVFENFTDGATLAEWFDITAEPIVAPPESNIDIPFSVTVPQDASPGGHFAAILIGTEPPKTEEAVQVRTSQVVTSLFFVRISGDVVEKGDIREFRVVNGLATEPTAEFELRFENKGNVHLQPQGNITIYNMWGEERGVIPINHETNFGNVLPESIRRFEFSWEGERSLTDIGRFTAVATLGYGEDERQFVTRSAVFWIVPVKEVALTIGAALLIFLIVSRIIKLYIRRMLILSGIDPDAPRRPHHTARPVATREGDVTVRSYRRLAAPVRSGVRDLLDRVYSVTNITDLPRVVSGFISAYRRFFLSLLALFMIGSGLLWYIGEAREDERLYEVTIATGDRDVVLTSEDVHYEREYDEGDTRVRSAMSTMGTSSPKTPVSLVNISGVPGAVATLRRQLEQADYEVVSSEVDLQRTETRSVIVFSLDRQGEAVALSKELGGIILSAGPATSTDTLRLFVGEDLAF